MTDMAQAVSTSAHTTVAAPRVLLVDDQERTAKGLGELLHLEGFIVTLATDGPGGIAAAANAPVDAVVLDIMLPGMSGFDVCRRLRRLAGTSHVPIVMLTGLSDTPSKLESFDIGADDYLVKPVPSRELAARLRKLISRRAETADYVHRQRVQAIGEIAAAVADDINHPLAAALRTIELVLLRQDLPPGVRGDLTSSRREMWRIASVLAQLTDVRDRTVACAGPDRMVVLGPGGHA
jgi:two-component system, OmpR family, response regulator MprA